MSPKYRRQYRNVCDLVLIFLQNQRLFFIEVRLYRSPSFNKCYGIYWEKTKLFLISWGDFKATWCAVVDKLWIKPVYASHKATSPRTSKNHIQWWEILPSSDEEITPLKTSLSLGYNLRKRMITKKNSISFTNRRWPTPNYNVCCVTRQYLFRIHFFASQRFSEGPAYLVYHGSIISLPFFYVCYTLSHLCLLDRLSIF